MKKCDICFNEEHLLTDLLERYQTSKVKEVCKECEKELNHYCYETHARMMMVCAKIRGRSLLALIRWMCRKKRKKIKVTNR